MSTLSFDDLDDGLTSASDARLPLSNAEARRRAHVANGGTVTQTLVACPKCRGTGTWGTLRSWDVRPCFRCQGKGKVTVRSAAATKAKQTREANERERLAAFMRDHRDVCAFLEANSSWSDFFRSLHTQVVDGRVLSERQIAAVRSAMVKIEAGRAAKAQARAASAPQVDMAAIRKLFDAAVGSGLKKPVFRAGKIEISTDRSAGTATLWVRDRAGVWLGKVEGSSFRAFKAAQADTVSTLAAVAADPLGQAKLFGKLTGNCSCCGRELTDPVSVANGIGPICQSKWGL